MRVESLLLYGENGPELPVNAKWRTFRGSFSEEMFSPVYSDESLSTRNGKRQKQEEEKRRWKREVRENREEGKERRETGRNSGYTQMKLSKIRWKSSELAERRRYRLVKSRLLTICTHFFPDFLPRSRTIFSLRGTSEETALQCPSSRGEP